MITCFALILNNLINYKGADIFRSCIIINEIILRQYNIKSFDQSIELSNLIFDTMISNSLFSFTFCM